MPKTAGRLRRGAGVFLPVASLPGPGGIGSFGPAAYRFVDWLARAGQRYWAILPLSIPDQFGSPYASRSSLAMNWLLISPKLLHDQGWLASVDIPSDSSSTIDYPRAARRKWRMIRDSYRLFSRRGTTADHRRFNRWRERQAWWLVNFTMFEALKDRYRQRPWWSWPTPYRRRGRAATMLDAALRRQMDFHAYAQWLADWQWQTLRTYARRQGLAVIGDMPFYVQEDSVDVWAHRTLFDVAPSGRPREVAGVPPDGFNPRGQRWGNPVYHWPSHRRENFAWWRCRFARHFARYDLVRFDHWQGLAETYHVRTNAPDARRGRWVKTPGRELLRVLKRDWPRLPLVAEDLGRPEPDAEHLRRSYDLPGSRLLLFGWSGLPKNIHHPDHVLSHCLYYTSNHDTNTILGWWRDQAHWYERKHLREYRPIMKRGIHWTAIDTVYRSRARVAMAPVQDLIGLGQNARLNRPGRRRGNWRWRLTAGALKLGLAQRLRRLAEQTRRV